MPTTSKVYYSHMRRAELARRGIRFADIAAACNVSRPTVTLIVDGERFTHPQMTLVANTIAEWCALPVDHLFPDWEPDKGDT